MVVRVLTNPLAWLGAAGLAVALAVGMAHRQPERLPVVAPPPRPIDVVLDGPDATRVGVLMQANGDVADDVIFLVAAAWQVRCVPARAHDLPNMAVVAGLPVLEAIAETMRKTTADVVRAAVRSAPCAAPFVLHVGPYVRRMDVDRYAERFPDSYFDPDMDAVPDEFASASLHQRAMDECSRVAYALLPLDALREWQCTGVRVGARNRIRALCRTEGAETERAAVAIRSMVDRLPVTCR